MPRDVLVRFQLDDRLISDNETARRSIEIWLDAAIGSEGYPVAHVEKLPEVVAVLGTSLEQAGDGRILPCPV